ncbi:MAG: hypothetical protein MUF72_07480 [Elainella sp. Prado103]|nr:hypothetical protein [Elainella sp. Prado103]
MNRTSSMMNALPTIAVDWLFRLASPYLTLPHLSYQLDGTLRSIGWAQNSETLG